MKKASPEEMKKGMELWMAWAKELGTGLVDLGTPVGDGQLFTKSGSSPSKSDINGYSILQAENMEEAKAMLVKHPHLNWYEGCTLEVFESLPMHM